MLLLCIGLVIGATIGAVFMGMCSMSGRMDLDQENAAMRETLKRMGL